ncbi:hypothetical protein [Burkholderia multivorans]|uniref:hypothetical protein n=1 Tax=Burkholderia multivorans TaxID=87883 RepID=UPI001C21EEC8|nr:hypothetical protein [Burkholderia multivorans]MBU9220555.1 hypothetical protein [Burkholderia multivorans]MBU9417008.1 hypothetical protein [Burkholderia multivorans]
MSTTQRKWLIALLLIGGGIATVAYTRYVKSYSDHEIKTTYFLKRYPTLQMEFHDPFANERDDVPIDQLAPRDTMPIATRLQPQHRARDRCSTAVEYVLEADVDATADAHSSPSRRPRTTSGRDSSRPKNQSADAGLGVPGADRFVVPRNI